jgi:hypothetical protein
MSVAERASGGQGKDGAGAAAEDRRREGKHWCASIALIRAPVVPGNDARPAVSQREVEMQKINQALRGLGLGIKEVRAVPRERPLPQRSSH